MKRGRPRSIRRTTKRVQHRRSPKQRAAAVGRAQARRRKGR